MFDVSRPSAMQARRLSVAVMLLSLVAARVSATQCSCPQTFRIGAFNLKTFGKAKMSNSLVAEKIRQVIERYDVLLLQEIRDSSEDSVYQLQDMLTIPYEVVISQPLGRSTYKEQYAVFYRPERFLFIQKHQYSDPHDVFEREPFVVLLAPKAIHSEKLALIASHIRPSDAVQEIGHLVDVIDHVQQTFGHDVEPIVLGDLNADCRYADQAARVAANDPLTLQAPRRYVWHIADHTDTTTTSTHCAYDRIISLSSLVSHVVVNSSQAFDFCDHLQLNATECHAISDHYPVELELHF